MISKKHNNKEIVLSEKETLYSNNNKESFSKYIKEIRKLIPSPSGKKYLSTEDLAKKVGINYEHFRKILNTNKPTKKRDCIIAICAMLELDSEETNKALFRYNNMPSLDTNNDRDDLLIDILEVQFRYHLNIQEINQRLTRRGFDELDIIDSRNSLKSIAEKEDFPYKLLKRTARNTTTPELLFGNRYDSISSEYSLYNYHCIAEMWLEEILTKKIYHLTAGTNSTYSMHIENENSILDMKSFKTPAESKIFKDCFLELESMAKREMKSMLSILNDTKNYQKRIGAKILNDAIYIYSETFNYSVPELNEYYLYEFKNGKEEFSVLKNSEFMRCHLDQDEYLSIYKNNKKFLVVKYNSIDEIENRKKEARIINADILNIRIRYFEELKKQSTTLLSDIKNKKKYIRHLDYIFDIRDSVCKFYNVEKEFKCSFVGEYGDIAANVDNHDFDFEDCGKVNITLNDLCEAFELGFNNINEICRVKKKYGSIKEILNI